MKLEHWIKYQKNSSTIMSTRCLPWHSLHNQCPNQHWQHVRTFFLHLLPLQRYCWYGAFPVFCHFPRINFVACLGAVIKLCSAKVVLFSLFDRRTVSLIYSLSIKASASFFLKLWSFIMSFFHTKWRKARYVLISLIARKKQKTLTNHVWVIQVCSKLGTLCRKLLWSSTACLYW